MSELKEIKPIKAYDNSKFIRSTEARTIRVICEFEEPVHRLRAEKVKETIMFWGSARAKTREQYTKAMESVNAKLASATTEEEKKKLSADKERLQASEWMCEVMQTTSELAKRVTEWAMSYESATSVGGGYLTKPQKRRVMNFEAPSEDALHGSSHNPWCQSDTEAEHVPIKDAEAPPLQQSLFVCTGGGPGLMEAANHGAYQVPGAKSIGMGIALPFEAGLNPYVTPELGFEFHYFFTRKYWMCYPLRGLVVAPGGFGTMGELFELLTLKHSGKIKIDLPIVLLGKDYWTKVINFDAMVKYGTIRRRDLRNMLITSDVEEAFTYLTTSVRKLREQDGM